MLTVSFIIDLLREGDELLEVTGVPVSGKSTDEIVTLMVSITNTPDRKEAIALHVIHLHYRGVKFSWLVIAKLFRVSVCMAMCLYVPYKFVDKISED